MTSAPIRRLEYAIQSATRNNDAVLAEMRIGNLLGDLVLWLPDTIRWQRHRWVCYRPARLNKSQTALKVDCTRRRYRVGYAQCESPGLRRQPMYLLLIFVSIIGTISCHRMKKSRLRHPTVVTGLQKVLGNDTATVSGACIVLVFVLLAIVSGAPGVSKQAAERTEREHAAHRTMAHYLAKELAADIDDNAKALVLDYDDDNGTYASYHTAALDGLKSGFGDTVEITVVKRIPRRLDDDDASATDRANALRLSKKDFDAIVKENKECSVIVSLIGLPNDYDSSVTRLQVKKNTLKFGVFQDDVYDLGVPLVSGEITACVVPKRHFSYDQLPPMDDLDAAFDSRFIFINQKNVQKIALAKENRRLFRRSKQ